MIPPRLFCFLAIFTSCSTSVRTCETGCPQGSRCDAETSLCVREMAPLDDGGSAPTHESDAGMVMSEPDAGPSPQFELTFPSASTVLSGASVELSGTVALAPERTLVSAKLEVAGNSIPLTIDGGSWTATVPLPQHSEGTLSGALSGVDDAARASSTGFQFAFDTLAPRFTIDAPLPTTRVGSSVTLTGTVEDAHPASVTIQSGSESIVARVNGRSWDAKITFPPGIDAAERTVEVESDDIAGNRSSAPLKLTVDTRAPEVEFSTPTAMDVVGPPLNHSISGQVRDSSPIAAVDITCSDGSAHTASVTGTAWTFQWQLPTSDNGRFTCTAVATDSVGNSSTVEGTYFVDTVGPVVMFASPSANALLGGPSQSTVVVSAGATDGSAVRSVTFSLGGSPVMAQVSNGAFSATVPLPGLDFVSVDIVAEATDSVGNTTTERRTIRVDRVPPVVQIVSPMAGRWFNASAFSAGNEVAVSWTVVDGDPNAGTLYFNRSAASPTDRRALVTTNSTDNGRTYTSSVDAIDSAGNVSVLATVTYFVDRVAPTVLRLGPDNGTRLYFEPVVDVVFSEDIAQRRTTQCVVLNGAPVRSTWLSPRYCRTDLLPGSTVYLATVLASLTDEAGNPVTQMSWRFHTQAALPSVRTQINTQAIEPNFDVASDPDGEPTIVVFEPGPTPTGGVATYTLRGTDGTWVRNQGNFQIRSPNSNEVSINVQGVVAADLSLARTRMIQAGGTWQLFEDVAGTPTTPSDLPIISPPVAPADGSALMGFVNPQSLSYVRDSSAPRTLPFFPQKLVVSQVGWYAFNQSGPVLSVAKYKCAEDIFTHQTACSIGVQDAPESLLGRGAISAAISSSGCGIVAYTNAGGVRKATVDNFRSRYWASGPFTATPVLPYLSVAPNRAGGLWVAFEASRTGSSSTIRIVNMPNCDLSQIANASGSKTVTIPFTDFDRVQVSQLVENVGVFYVSATGGLRVAY